MNNHTDYLADDIVFYPLLRHTAHNQPQFVYGWIYKDTHLIVTDSLIQPPRMFTNATLKQLILPLIVEQVLAVSIGMADTIMIASVGEASVSAVSLVDSLSNFFLQLFAAICTGGAVVVAQYIGQKDRSKAGDAAKQLIYATTFLALIIMIFLLIYNRKILGLIYGSLDTAVMRNAEIYFMYILISFPFIAIYNSGAALFRSMGDSRTSMNIALIMNFINISGNAFLIYGARWGVAGAGTATLTSRVVGALMMLLLVSRRGDKLQIHHLLRVKFQWPMIKRILRIGIPSGIEGSMFHIGRILVQSLIASMGTTALAANAIGNAIAGFANIPGTAIGLATVTVVGQCMGAGQPKQAEYFTKWLLAMVYIALSIITLGLFLMVEPMVGLFRLSQASSTLAVQILRVCFIMNLLFWPLSFSLPQALRAAGDARFTMLVSIFSMWTFRIALSYLLGRYLAMGLMGVWIAMYIDWVCRSACFTTRFLGGKWKLKRVL
jgi:putative MATE family efflux protein